MTNDYSIVFNPEYHTYISFHSIACLSACPSAMLSTTTITMSSSYIKTATNNYVSRAAVVEGPSRVELKGKSVLQKNVTVRGDLATIRMGRYCFLEESTTLEPAKINQEKHVPMFIRGNVYIGKNCVIHAASIGTNVYIDDNCVIGERAIIKDNCWITEGTHLGNDTVIPPFSRVSDGRVVEELPPSAATELQEMAHKQYQDFVNANPMTS